MKPANVLALIGLAGLAVGWLFSVEYRLGTYQATLDVSKRVENLEELLVPVLVEFRAREIVRERNSEAGREGIEPPLPSTSGGTSGTGFSGLPAPIPSEEVDMRDVREEATKWANDAIMAPQTQNR